MSTGIEDRHPKTLIRHPGDYNSTKPLTVKDILKMSTQEACKEFYFKTARINTGAYLMYDSFLQIVDGELATNNFDFSKVKVDSVITNIFHNLGHGSPKFDELRSYLEKDIKVIPMSLGFAGKVNLNEDLKWLLCEISERNEIGCRNEFSAETLRENGIRNVRVIGCPSFYYHMNRDFAIDNNKKQKLSSINFNSGVLNPFNEGFGGFIKYGLPLLKYFQNYFYKNRSTVQTYYTLQEPFFNEIFARSFNALEENEIRHEFEEFYKECGRYFFSVDDWIAALKQNDFSFGSKFHGNVAAILAGTPALLLGFDSRTIGFADYHKIPSMKLWDFDPEKPIEYYYELADYTEFNKNYAKTYDNFVDFCRKNDVALRIDTGNFDIDTSFQKA